MTILLLLVVAWALGHYYGWSAMQLGAFLFLAGAVLFAFA